MCWIENIKSLDLQITDRDIEVYKIVSDANKWSCESLIQGFVYKANIRYEMNAMELKKINLGSAFCTFDLIYITKAYHSYTKIHSRNLVTHIQNMDTRESLQVIY